MRKGETVREDRVAKANALFGQTKRMVTSSGGWCITENPTLLTVHSENGGCRPKDMSGIRLELLESH